MFTGSLDYTICSSDPEHYNRIYCNLVTPMTEYTSIIVTSLTCNCDMIVLDKDDYVKIKVYSKPSVWKPGEKLYEDIFTYIASKRCKSFDRSSAPYMIKQHLFSQIEEDLSDEPDKQNIRDSFKVDLDENTGLFRFESNNEFIILDMSYNAKLIAGLYNTQFPIHSIKGKNDKNEEIQCIEAKSIGFTMSTPILYLTSNIGVQSYRTSLDNKLENSKSYGLRGSKIVMRINNSFVSDAPVIVNNADFQTIIPSNDLSMLEFKLVDANMQEVKLLSPMYITIHCDAIKDEDLMNYIMFSNEVQKELQKIQGAKAFAEQQQQITAEQKQDEPK